MNKAIGTLCVGLRQLLDAYYNSFDPETLALLAALDAYIAKTARKAG